MQLQPIYIFSMVFHISVAQYSVPITSPRDRYISHTYQNEQAKKEHIYQSSNQLLPQVAGTIPSHLSRNTSLNGFEKHDAIRYPTNNKLQSKFYINLEKYMRNLTRPIGAKAEFYCDILGQPIPRFQWHKDNQQLIELDGKLRIETGLWGSSLRIDNLQQSDSGVYKCIATNSAGSINATAFLRITEPILKLTASQPLHRIREDCLRNLMEATCYYNFPLCLPVRNKQGKPEDSHQPFYLCQQDCQSVMEDECQGTYKYLQRTLMHSVPTMMMDCARLPSRQNDYPNNCRALGKQVPKFLTIESHRKNNLLPDGQVDADQPSGPDLIPLFVSVGVMFLVGFVLLAFCFLCRRSSVIISDNSTLFGRTQNGLGFGRLNGTACGRRLTETSIRGQGVGASKDYPRLKKRHVPGMGSHVKLADKKKNGLLNNVNDGYALAYPSNTNGIRSVSETSNNFGSGLNPFVNGLASLSSGPTSQIQSTNDSLMKFNPTTSVNYHPYQAPTFVTQPSLPPPNGPAPPPPPNGTIFLPSNIFSMPPTTSNSNGSGSLNSQGYHQGSRGSGDDDNHNNRQQPFIQESPTAYTTLRGASGNGTCYVGRLQGSFVKLDDAKNDDDRATYSVADLEESKIFPTEYSLSQLRFGKQFGQGVFGPLYKAELLPSNTYENGLPISVIVKALSAGSPRSLQADFKREAQLISELDHPNVLSLLGVSLQCAPWCMIFEVRQYMDLCELLALRRSTHAAGKELVPYPGPSMTDAERLHVLAQIALGMEYLSNHRFVHRDLAARNVLILNDELDCKITDLGLARDCYAADYYRMHPHSLMFPIRWMPLEAILYGHFTVQSDIWAYGVLSWEIWSGGMRPYSNSSDMDVLEHIRNRQLLPITSSCPPEIYKFMLDCWNSEPQQRPSFRDCVEQISHWQYNLTVAGQWRSTSTPSTPNLNGVRVAHMNSPAVNEETAKQSMKERHTDHSFGLESPEIFSTQTPRWFDQYTNNNAMHGNLGVPNGVHTPSLSPDGSSSNEKGHSVPRFNHPFPNPFTVSNNHSNNSPLPGIEMRLLPNTTTMYMPTADSVL